jgi:hypothetical protein
MGGIMYSMQTGHSSSLRMLSLKPRNRLVISGETGSENRIFEMVTLRKIFNFGGGAVFSKSNSK